MKTKQTNPGDGMKPDAICFHPTPDIEAKLLDIQRHLCSRSKATALSWAITQAHKLLEVIGRAVAEAVPHLVRESIGGKSPSVNGEPGNDNNKQQ